jgi:hypothetical protein
MILTLVQQQAIKPIDQNNWPKYPQIAKEIEESKLKELLGVALLQDLQVNPTSDNNKLLLNSTSFVDYNGNTIKHQGLNYVIAYLNYSHYLGSSNFQDTFTGFVKNKRPDAESLTNGEITRMQGDIRSIALSEFEIIKQYLNQNSDKYPLWACTGNKKIYCPKFYSVRKTQN